MKKLLILILIALLTSVSFIFVLKGSTVLGMEIPGIPTIKEKNKEVDTAIKNAAKAAESDFNTAISTLKNDAKKLTTTKEEYTDLTGMSEEGEIQNAGQIEKYEVEALWVRLGNHATANGLTPKFDVVSSSGKAKDVYDLKVTARGSYISIMDFISAIENDSTLGFKIEEFKLKPSGQTERVEKSEKEKEKEESGKPVQTVGVLECTFTCKDILIKDVTATAPEKDEEGKSPNEKGEKNPSKNANSKPSPSSEKDDEKAVEGITPEDD